MAIAPATTDDVLGTGHPGWVRVVGLALLPFAALVVWLSTTHPERLRLVTPGVIAGDAAWVVASIATIALGWYSGGGIALVVAMAVMVDVWAFLQWSAWRQLRPTH